VRLAGVNLAHMPLGGGVPVADQTATSILADLQKKVMDRLLAKLADDDEAAARKGGRSTVEELVVKAALDNMFRRDDGKAESSQLTEAMRLMRETIEHMERTNRDFMKEMVDKLGKGGRGDDLMESLARKFLDAMMQRPDSADELRRFQELQQMARGLVPSSGLTFEQELKLRQIDQEIEDRRREWDFRMAELQRREALQQQGLEAVRTVLANRGPGSAAPAFGLTAPAPAPPEAPAPAAPTPPRLALLRCSDCGGEIIVRPNGKVPRLCPYCGKQQVPEAPAAPAPAPSAEEAAPA